jgi:hypothetical protein
MAERFADAFCPSHPCTIGTWKTPYVCMRFERCIAHNNRMIAYYSNDEEKWYFYASWGFHLSNLRLLLALSRSF